VAVVKCSHSIPLALSRTHANRSALARAEDTLAGLGQSIKKFNGLSHQWDRSRMAVLAGRNQQGPISSVDIRPPHGEDFTRRMCSERTE
jgi:hypothetical protein